MQVALSQQLLQRQLIDRCVKLLLNDGLNGGRLFSSFSTNDIRQLQNVRDMWPTLFGFNGTSSPEQHCCEWFFGQMGPNVFQRF